MSRKLNLNDKLHDGESVIYIMSRDQRVHDNHALLTAQKVALDKKVPLIVVFNLLERTGHRTQEHFRFMLEGLKEVGKELSKHNVRFVLTHGDPVKEITNIANILNPGKIIFDFNPLKGPRETQKVIASKVEYSVSVVDAHNIIPLWIASDKEEYAAHTFRPKVHKLLHNWLAEFDQIVDHPYTLNDVDLGISWEDADNIVKRIPKNGQSLTFAPGESAAQSELNQFINDRLPNYAEKRNIPTVNAQSNLSPYLHFGQISSQRVALEVIKKLEEDPLLFRMTKLASYEGNPTLDDSINAFLEELIVRKELADNYCFFSPNYTNIEGAKDWAKESLNSHLEDKREFTYTKNEWESANTHDEAWNAAQNEMVKTGKMHGYMRMYWAKKILEWSKSPQEAIEIAIYLNDKYSIDGGDPNGYTGIMWSIAGVHDRPWFEREVFGKIRYMNRGGLERRFKVDEYIKLWN